VSRRRRRRRPRRRRRVSRRSFVSHSNTVFVPLEMRINLPRSIVFWFDISRSMNSPFDFFFSGARRV